MCNSERKPHVHAEQIKAWADGNTIQYWCNHSKRWVDTVAPCWSSCSKYRIKPEPSDFEKYGIEKGDVWKVSPEVAYSFTVLAVHSFSFTDTEGTTSEPYEKMVLLFRRGVVDNL